MNDFSYPFKYELYSPDELAFMITFIDEMERAFQSKEMPCLTLKPKYKKYRQIIQNQSEEKRIDEVIKKELGFSLYALIQSCE
jgi:uncharacterized protein YktA (UPF0223 family)